MEGGRAGRTWVVDGSGSGGFRTVQEAVDAASDGDVVFVRSGVYYEHVFINKTISLIGDNPFDTIIDAGQEVSASVILIEADNITVKNLTLRNSVGSSDHFVGGGIYVYRSRGCTIEDCIAFHNQNGINLFESSDNNVSHNLAEGNEVGIRVGSSEENNPSNNNLIKENWIDEMRVGFFVHNNTIAENCFFESTSLTIWSPAGGVVYHNNFMGDTPFSIDAQMGELNFTWSKNGEGNFYKNYSGSDADGDGIGDAPYVIQYLLPPNPESYEPSYGNTSDNCPLMKPYKWLQGDVNYDTVVNIIDVSKIAKAYGSSMGDANWNPRCDLNNDKTINILDISLAASDFGRKMSWQPI
jgi:parallel beta-helix repeat protein